MRKLLSHSTFIKAMVCLVIVCLAIFSLNSCIKDATETAEIEKLSKNEKESNEANRFSVPLYCEDLENPCTDPACQPYYDCEPPTPLVALENFFSTYDYAILSNPDSIYVASYMKSKNQELINSLSIDFPQTYLINHLDSTDVLVTWAGLIHMLAEGEGYFSSGNISQARIAVNWVCVKDVLLGFFDVASLVEDYAHLIKSGGTWSSVRGLLWRTLKRYGGWWAAAGVIYDISTDCF